MEHITILGDGSWGTACATICAYNGINVTLWCYNEDVAHAIDEQHENTSYLSGITLNTKRIHPTTSLTSAVRDAETVCFAIPVKFLRSVLTESADVMHAGQQWISLSKGIEQETQLFPTQIALDVAPVKITPGVIAGPSFAREVAQHKPTGMLCGMHSYQHAEAVMHAFTTDYMSIAYTNDVIGTQIAGALKNIYAIASGILDTLTDANNATALLTTQAIHEMQAFADALGADRKTLLSRAGLGDMILTCHGSQSRNRRVGQQIGSGTSLSDYLEQVDFVPEGVNTSKAVMPLMAQYNISAPIIMAVHNILHKDASANTLVQTLLTQM